MVRALAPCTVTWYLCVEFSGSGELPGVGTCVILNGDDVTRLISATTPVAGASCY